MAEPPVAEAAREAPAITEDTLNVLPLPQVLFHVMPVQDVLHALPLQDVGRLLLADRCTAKAVAGLRPEVLVQRGLHRSWTWRKARAAERAFFRDALSDPLIWTPGPNERGDRNLLEHTDEASPWLWLSGGTDWQGFQGGFHCVSIEGIRPAWVTFRVRVATPELSGAFLTLSGGQHLWGMADPVLVFNFRGDDCPKHARCFAVQPYSGHGTVTHYVRPTREVVDDTPYDVALHLDWAAGRLCVFVDGERLVDGVPMQRVKTPIRFAAIYNWRSKARTAFSELMLGNDCPCDQLSSLLPRPNPQQPRAICRCPRRAAGAAAAGASSALRAAVSAVGAAADRGPTQLGVWAAKGALLAVAAAAALQWAVAR